MSADSIFGPIPTDPRDKWRQAAALALQTARDFRRMAEDQANYYVNEHDWQLIRSHWLYEAEKREAAARDYQAQLEWKP